MIIINEFHKKEKTALMQTGVRFYGTRDRDAKLSSP